MVGTVEDMALQERITLIALPTGWSVLL